METKFTKGEWRIQDSGDDEYIDIESDAGRVCSIFVAQESDIAPEQSVANANLIIMAPKLLLELRNAIITIQKLLSISTLDSDKIAIYKRELANHEFAVYKATHA